MLHKLKFPAIVLLFAFTTAWIGKSLFSYFTHGTPPEISLVGLENNGIYGKMLECSVKSTGSYKVSRLVAHLDDKEFDLGSTGYPGKAVFQLPFNIDTNALNNGQHTLTIEAIDGSYNKNKNSVSCSFFIDNTPLTAALVSSDYRVDQGKTLHMKIQSNKKLSKAMVKFLTQIYQFYPESEDSTTYECFIPVDCEETPGESMVTVEVEDHIKNSCKLPAKVRVAAFAFKKQHGFSVDPAKLEQEKEVSMNSRILTDALNKWVKESPTKKLWGGAFEYPIDVQRMTTPFGEIRMTPERGRYMHKGLDLLNRPKCVVWASQHGKVIIKDRYLDYGNTVVLDHGRGVFTLYAHLEDFSDINVGDTIKKGNPIGRLGMTGYATGYHLHWEVRVNNVAVDPMEWTTKIY